MDIQESNPLFAAALYIQQLQERNAFLEDQGNKLLQQVAQLQQQIAAPPAPPSPNAHDAMYARLLTAGQFAAYLGIPYKFGAEYKNDKAFDCSSFTQAIFGFNGISLRRVSKDQADQGTAVANLDQAIPGDLIFYKYGTRNGAGEPDHVGMYVGNGQMLHTNDPAKPIRIETISSYSKSKIVSIRRFF